MEIKKVLETTVKSTHRLRFNCPTKGGKNLEPPIIRRPTNMRNITTFETFSRKKRETDDNRKRETGSKRSYNNITKVHT